MKNKKSKNIIVGIIFTIFFILGIFFISDTRNLLGVESSVKDLISFPFRIFSREVNLEVSSKVVDTIEEERDDEIHELKSILDLNIVNSSVEYINSTIINKNSSWYDIITLDKGGYQGIKKGMCVINGQGFVGEVIKTSNNTSEIKLITSPSFDNKISVSVGGQYGVTTNYDLKKNVLLVDGIKDLKSVSVGDKVTTSGLTSLYPRGILIGEVSNIRKDKYKMEKYLEVKLSANIKNSHYVSVIKKWLYFIRF